MVNTLAVQSEDQKFSCLMLGSALIITLCCFLKQRKKLYFTLSVFTEMYKWVLVKTNPGGNPVMDYHPIQGGSSNTHWLFLAKRPELNASCVG